MKVGMYDSTQATKCY